MAIRSLANNTFSRSLLVGNSYYIPPQAYESIQTYTLSSSQSSITFSNIPSTYKHLQIRALARSTYTRAGGNLTPVAWYMYVGNNGTIYSTNYSWHGMNSLGSGTPTGEGYGIQSLMVPGNQSIPGSNATSGIFGMNIIDILDYTSTTKAKTIRSISGVDENGAGGVSLYGGSYYGTPNAITDIQLTTDGNFAQYSTFALYGVRG